MSSHIPLDPDDNVIDISPAPNRRRRRIWLILPALVFIFVLFRSLSIYISALWFDSLGYSAVYWYMFRLKLALFAIFALLTVAIVRGAFWLLERVFASSMLERRVVMVNNQPVNISPARLMRPVAWIVAIIFGLIYGTEWSASWRSIALYLHQTSTGNPDPIFGKPLGFYLFTLPVYEVMSGWLIALALIILVAAIVYTIVGKLPQKPTSKKSSLMPGGNKYAAVSFALAAFLLMLAWRVYLSRFPYLWDDHQTFSGVTYTEANYLLPGLLVVAIALAIAAVIALVNAFTTRGLRLLILSVALPIIVYIVAGLMIPGYVTSFIVKPNELQRETPYIEHNIAWTRKAFALDHIELREFDVDTTVEAFNLEGNRPTLDNIRLWDWRALQDTLRQVQEIRTYYDFPDVDIDRYRVAGQMRQMMLAAREIDDDKLPEQSRNWVNQKLIYTHGYGVTMNTANGFTPEGMPQFVLSDMPVAVAPAAPEIKITRPEIYFGQKTNTNIYVKTKQKEFNYPQGEANNYTSYEGTGGIRIGGSFRRLLLAWALDDVSKLPFSDDVTPDSLVQMHRNIEERVQSLAPFLVYDKDPYIVVTDDGRLFWMIDAFTETANYPYSRHYTAGDKSINYMRNSVKVAIDAYNGTTTFYVFDAQDPLINAYRATFPTLFRDASEMPADLRAHVRYPETLIQTQGEVFGLYHTQNTKVFFQREDMWSVASQNVTTNKGQQQQPLEPYFLLMQLPGEQIANEFVEILPFTPSNRNNMIGWMAGRSDGANYGSLLVYNFPKSRLIDGPLQVEARIDQDSQLSGKFTLWNQQGSKVVRGNLLVIPIGSSLLYAEPIYLKAERSPMPELRLVVLATQERLGYGPTFGEALTSLFGDAIKNTAQPGGEQVKPQPTDGSAQPPTPQATPQATPQQSVQQLINQASQEFADYQRLTSEGKYGEAGQKLDSLKRTLEELKKASGKP